MSTPHSQPADPWTAFWRDWMSRMGAMSQQNPFAAGGAGAPGASGAIPGFPPSLTPESLRQMQASFLDALSQQCDAYMRSPQFLDSMRRSMDQALDLRRRMEQMMNDNAAAAFAKVGASGMPGFSGMPTDPVSFMQLLTSMRARLEQIESRVAILESTPGAAGSPPSAAARKRSASNGAVPKKKSSGGSRARSHKS